MSFINGIGVATPSHRFDQSSIAEFMVKAMNASDQDARKIRTVFRMSGINTRHSVLADYGKTSGFTFYPESESEVFPGTARRMQLYRENALPLSIAAIRNLTKAVEDFDLRKVTHLVVVSCTGMYAPGLDIDIIKELKISHSVQRTCINFMGCYAAFNGLKVADAFCARDSAAKVLVVCTELCSIHFQRTVSDDNILANALFADGAAAVLVEASPGGAKCLSIEAFHNDLALNGEADMAWEIGDLGFEMKLSSYVPDLVKEGIVPILHGALAKLPGGDNRLSYFALHPGGKKIVAVIAEKLGLGDADVEPALTVLRNYGNMSSATVLFVLNSIFETLAPSDDQSLIFSAAFGPGLTLESMILKTQIR